MKILAVEFSSEQRSVAVSEGGFVHGSASEPASRNTHAFALIEQALAGAGWQREEIECLAIGLGPGSYTGIRTAIALAQGWQLATGVKLVGVSTAECLAADAHVEGHRGKAGLVIDAQRNEFYLATCDLSAGGVLALSPLKLATLAEVRAHSAAGELIIGPGTIQFFAEAKTVFPTAATLARLAAARTDFVAGETLEPIYLRETTFVKAPPPRILPT